MSEHALAIRDIRRSFIQGGRRLDVLKGCTLDLAPGEIVGLLGPSGSGKSTLLHVAGLLERPEGGRVIVDGRDCGALGDDERTRIRREYLGFVYQFHYLMAEFSALENVMVPCMIAGASRRAARERAALLLDMLGLADRADHRPARLSGGEQQRVALARAMANAPRVLLADEPTGNLDPATAEEVFGAIADVVHRTGVAALVATHNLDLAARMDRMVRLHDGVVVPA